MDFYALRTEILQWYYPLRTVHINKLSQRLKVRNIAQHSSLKDFFGWPDWCPPTHKDNSILFHYPIRAEFYQTQLRLQKKWN